MQQQPLITSYILGVRRALRTYWPIGPDIYSIPGTYQVGRTYYLYQYLVRTGSSYQLLVLLLRIYQNSGM